MKFGIKKLESREEIMTLHFDTIPARDGRTDGETDGHVAIAITRASNSIASRE